MNEQQRKQRDEERRIMEAFVDVIPEFAGEPIASWDLTAIRCDPPDVICLTASSQRVGIEIAQWANREEMRGVNSRQRREGRIVKALKPLFKADLGFTVYFRASMEKLESNDYEAFREAFVCMVDACTRSWDRLADIHLRKPKLSQFRLLGTCPDKVVLSPSEAIYSPNWLLPFATWSCYNDDTMWKPLRSLIENKKRKCQAPKTSYDRLFLLIAYDQALGNCSPTQPQFQSVSEFVEGVAQQFHADPGTFHGGFLLLPGDPVPTLHRLL